PRPSRCSGTNAAHWCPPGRATSHLASSSSSPNGSGSPRSPLIYTRGRCRPIDIRVPLVVGVTSVLRKGTRAPFWPLPAYRMGPAFDRVRVPHEDPLLGGGRGGT